MGKDAGSVSPSSTPVITAEPSPHVPGLPIAYSAPSAPSSEAPMTRRALGPKNQTAAATTGTKPTTTVHMMRGMESALRTCGDEVMMRRRCIYGW